MKIPLTLAVLFAYTLVQAQPQQTENLMIITLDGFRWQELFNGADSSILFNKTYTTDATAIPTYWHSSPNNRRERLLPFIWETLAMQGQVYGNRKYNNEVNCANPHWFSYPGYSELFTGFVDRRVKSNEKIVNPNSTVFEFINSDQQYKGKIAAFSTWDVIPFIIRAEEAGITNNCGKRLATSDSLTQSEILLNELQQLINPSGERLDAFTFYYAFEYLKKERPRVLYIGLDETDQHGHGGRYDSYLKAAHQADAMIRLLWDWLQTDAQYKNKTTLLITTDHGRGKGAKHAWKDHGRLAFGSGQMWFALIGPDTPPTGEMKVEQRLFQKQLAKTMAALLGLNYLNIEPVGEQIESVFYPTKSITKRISE